MCRRQPRDCVRVSGLVIPRVAGKGVYQLSIVEGPPRMQQDRGCQRHVGDENPRALGTSGRAGLGLSWELPELNKTP